MLTAHAWYFLTVITILTFVIYELSLGKKRIKIDKNVYKWAPLYASIVLLTLVPPFVSFASGTSISSVTADGGVAKLSVYWYAAFIATALLLLFSTYRKTNNSSLKAVQILAISSLAFMFTVGAFQILKGGKLNYYFFKSVYLLVIPVIVTGVYVYGLIVQKLYKKNDLSNYQSTLAISLVVISSVILIVVLKPTNPYAYWRRWLHTFADPTQIERVLKDRKPNEDWVFVGGCDNKYEYLNNRWTGAVLLTETTKRYWLLDANIHPGEDSQQLIEYIREKPQRNIKLLYQSGCTDKDKIYKLQSPYVKVVPLD